MTKLENTRQTLLEGQVVELWENPDAPFACDPRALAAYASSGEWELLFNGIMLQADHRPGPAHGVFKAPFAPAPVASL